MRKVVITGLGAITPVGNNVSSTWEAAKQGVCGIAPITHYDTETHKVKLAAEVKDFPLEDYFTKAEARKLDDFCIYALAAAKEALYTGHIGDGKIFVYDVAKVVKVRTGEEDLAALKDVE